MTTSDTPLGTSSGMRIGAGVTDGVAKVTSIGGLGSGGGVGRVKIESG